MVLTGEKAEKAFETFNTKGKCGYFENGLNFTVFDHRYNYRESSFAKEKTCKRWIQKGG